MSKPLVETIKRHPLDWPGQMPLDMATRGPKILTKLVPTWSRDHAELALEHAEAREAARKRYGRS